jgi:hypothetical protein
MVRQGRNLIGAKELIHHLERGPEEPEREVFCPQAGRGGFIDDFAGAGSIAGHKGLEEAFSECFEVHGWVSNDGSRSCGWIDLDSACQGSAARSSVPAGGGVEVGGDPCRSDAGPERESSSGGK